MTYYLSIYDLSSYLATFVQNMQSLWVVMNTSVYDLLWGQLYDMIPIKYNLARIAVSLISQFFYNMQDVTILSLLLGGFAVFFIGFTFIKFLLDLVS